MRDITKDIAAVTVCAFFNLQCVFTRDTYLKILLLVNGIGDAMISPYNKNSKAAGFCKVYGIGELPQLIDPLILNGESPADIYDALKDVFGSGFQNHVSVQLNHNCDVPEKLMKIFEGVEPSSCETNSDGLLNKYPVSAIFDGAESVKIRGGNIHITYSASDCEILPDGFVARHDNQFT